MPRGERKSRAAGNRFRYRYFGKRLSEEESQKRQALFPISTGVQHRNAEVLILEQQLMEWRNQPSSTLNQTTPVNLPSNPVKDIEVIDLELEILTSTITHSTSVTLPNVTQSPPNSHAKDVGLTDVNVPPRTSTLSEHEILPGMISNTHRGAVKKIEVIDVELEYQTSVMSIRGAQVPTTMDSVNHHVQNWINSIQNPCQLTDGLYVGDAAFSGLSSATPVEGECIAATANPLSGGKGMCLLQKMGWQPGKGLGKNSEGILEPVTVIMKKNKRGLATQEELQVLPQVLPQMLYPLSATNPKLGEKWSGHPLDDINKFCILKGCGLPVFEIVCQDPSSPTERAGGFMCSVLVNGIVYNTPAAGSQSIKLAKRAAATVCLRANGVY